VRYLGIYKGCPLIVGEISRALTRCRRGHRGVISDSGVHYAKPETEPASHNLLNTKWAIYTAQRSRSRLSFGFRPFCFPTHVGLDLDLSDPELLSPHFLTPQKLYLIPGDTINRLSTCAKGII
jgi:hypothetical protein